MATRAIPYLFLTLTVAVLLDDQPYCSLRYRRLCQGKGRHVACQFPVPGASPSCSNYTKIKFTSDLRHFITHYINRRRQRIAAGSERVRGGAILPKPQVMMWVEWDRELAHLAQRLADQCQFVHDDCRATVRYPYAGQSVGEVRWRRSGVSEELTAQRVIRRVFDAWWGERRRVSPKQITGPFRLAARGNVWGHFSQLAVWTLRAVGCGAVRHGTTHTRLLLVCDFSHTNMLGERTVNPGPLAACPMHTARKLRSTYPLLCAPVRHTPPPDSDDKDDDYDDDDEQEDQMQDDGKAETRKHLTSKRYQAETRTTIRVIDRLAMELDGQQYSTRRRIPTSKKLYFGDVRYELENKLADKLPRFEKEHVQDSEGTRVSETYADVDYTQRVQVARHKWKQTRYRPIRPGANALLSKPVEKPIERPTEASNDRRLVSLMIDKDDVDQLFRDTGFKITNVGDATQ
ncbi:CRISP/Allergen/PR-1 [Zerene cesonia]|uniref:CRISP/Allergen/PR-1 n=1 Tax=Zerene cesonia TaxID=33412 RepID=UPI0018E595A6|nr:CRISP/Allergen/PR-1 [Zerene cesonia]